MADLATRTAGPESASPVESPASRPRPGAADRRLAARATAALAMANARYWIGVAPRVRRRLHLWESRAPQIPDPEERALALEKLEKERFNAEAAAMLATAAPASHRGGVTDAIVALELLFDYLDGLTERPAADPLRQGERLFASFTAAIEPGSDFENGRGYLGELSAATKAALRSLPGTGEVAAALRRSAARGFQAQTRMHAAGSLGIAQLEAWATDEAGDTDMQWREFLAGAAASVLALHALIAAAAHPRVTRAQAQEIEAVYLSICAVVTLLDGLVDQAHDADAGTLSYTGLYEDPRALGQALVRASRSAVAQARNLPYGAHHIMTLSGAVAYYASAPGAQREPARSAIGLLQSELGGLVVAPMLLMRGWRAVRHLRTAAVRPQP